MEVGPVTGRVRATRSVALSLSMLAALGLIAWLAGRAPPGERTSTTLPPSIVIISLDTLRADHLASYGYSRTTSPRLDSFASESVRFAQALSQATGTLPSHLSLLTSLYPPQFRITRDDGINDNQASTRLRLPEAVTTLAETLRERGYETVAFTDGGPMSPIYGHDQGFDRYVVNARRGLRRTLAGLNGVLQQRTDSMSDTGGTARRRPIFLFLHTFDIHQPYRAPEPYSRSFSRRSFEEMESSLGYPPNPSTLNRRQSQLTPAQVDEIEDLYDNGIAWTDDAVASVFELLDEHGLYEESVITVLSDHGDAFLDHGVFGHGASVYDELIRVPLMIRLPSARHAGRVIEEPVALVDVAPTLLEIAGLPVPAGFQGTSISGVIEGTEGSQRLAERPVYFENPRASRGLHGLRLGRWKFIRNESLGTVELYDLEADPDERTNLADRNASIREELEERLSVWVEDMEGTGRRKGWFATPRVAPSTPKQQEALRALGYIE